MFNLKRFFVLLICAITLFILVFQSYVIYSQYSDINKLVVEWAFLKEESVELTKWNDELAERNEFLARANRELATGIGNLWIENGVLKDELKKVKKNREFKVEKKYEY